MRAFFYSNEVLILKECKTIKLFKMNIVDNESEYDPDFQPGSLKFMEYY